MELRGLGMAQSGGYEVPEWKEKALGGWRALGFPVTRAPARIVSHCVFRRCPQPRGPPPSGADPLGRARPWAALALCARRLLLAAPSRTDLA